MQQNGAALMSRITTDAETMKSCAPQLSIGRSDKFRPHSITEYAHEEPKIHIEGVKPDIVILNVGAHYNRDMEGYHADLVYVANMVRELRATSPKNITFVWKTMNPGHVNCSGTSNGPLMTNFRTIYITQWTSMAVDYSLKWTEWRSLWLTNWV